MLHGGDLVVVEPGGPRHDSARIHFHLVFPVELGRLGERAFLAELVGAKVGVAVPQLLVPRHLVEHLAPLAVPLGVLRLVEYLLGHVSWADHRAGHDAGYLPARPGKAEYVPGEDADALARLLERPGRLARLRIVDHDELRADRPAVRLLVLHAAYASRYARHADEDSGRGRSANRRKDDLVRSPGDPRPLALVELSRAAVCDSLEAGYRVAHLREVGGEMLVHLELGLDRVEDLERGGLGRSHHDHELAVSVQHRPDGCGLGERRLARPA